MASTNRPSSPTTAAFSAQAALSFAVSLVALGIGLAFLPVDPWVRGFLAVGLLYCVTSAFTLAKVIRDRQDEDTSISRADQARLARLLAEHDPFGTTS